jgi:hypothetical protein
MQVSARFWPFGTQFVHSGEQGEGVRSDENRKLNACQRLLVPERGSEHRWHRVHSRSGIELTVFGGLGWLGTVAPPIGDLLAGVAILTGLIVNLSFSAFDKSL